MNNSLVSKDVAVEVVVVDHKVPNNVTLSIFMSSGRRELAEKRELFLKVDFGSDTQWRSQTRAHAGPGLGVSYEHGRFPKRIWLILAYSAET